MNSDDFSTMQAVYKQKVPQPLTSQFTKRKDRDEAIRFRTEQKKAKVEIYPPGTLKSSVYCFASHNIFIHQKL